MKYQRRATDNISLKRLVWMGIVVLGASLPHWPTLPLWVPLLLTATLGWRISAQQWSLPLPNKLVRVVLALSAFGLILGEFRTINGLSAGSALLVVMVALKFLESRNQRDQLVLMLISYFLVFSGLLYEGSALTALYLLVFVWLTTVGLLQLSRRGDLMENATTTRLAGKLLLQSMPLMIVLFLLFPRLPGPLWGIPADASSATTGLSDSMSPGDITDLGLSDEIAFRVDFFDREPAPADLYWRGPVLARFDGRTWHRREGMWGNVQDTIEFSGEPIEYRVMLEPQRNAWAYALEMPTAWTSTRRRNIVMRSDYQLSGFFTPAFNERFDYEVTSYSDFIAGEPMTPEQQSVYLRLPEGFNPRTEALMAQLSAGSPDAETLIQRALNVFAADEFFYTLTPPPLGTDSIDDFLFETREGFCEHYASAFTVMMRMVGIPSRVVTGYQGGELNALGDYYIVRQSNAHAWTEVWLEDQGWIRVDPLSIVAPERIAFGLSDSTLGAALTAGATLARMGLIRQAALLWDAVNTRWRNWVLDYGPELQRSLLEALGFGRLRWVQMLWLSIVAASAILVSLTLYLAWNNRASFRHDRAERAFRRFSQRAARLARTDRRRLGEGPVAFGERIAGSLPEQSLEISAIVDAYLAARYEPDPRQSALQRLEQLIRRFRRGAVLQLTG